MSLSIEEILSFGDILNRANEFLITWTLEARLGLRNSHFVNMSLYLFIQNIKKLLSGNNQSRKS
eukprot:snap_masked-scaffold_1-processed-gene-18.35-mRNA-1 protein AED:1.00 eAED:1.00 QI:0/0/0/0/1/1/2/0/63